ncbi:MAG TPA: hypothetical protein VGL12_02580 [Roseiarcus sp.]
MFDILLRKSETLAMILGDDELDCRNSLGGANGRPGESKEKRALGAQAGTGAEIFLFESAVTH